jgi:response regulator of citrate/malate metabolism
MRTNTSSLSQSVQQTLLIVEDEFTVANDLRVIVEKAGYKVSGVALSVARALEINKQVRPDMVLLDIHLNGTRRH